MMSKAEKEKVQKKRAEARKDNGVEATYLKEGEEGATASQMNAAAAAAATTEVALIMQGLPDVGKNNGHVGGSNVN